MMEWQPIETAPIKPFDKERWYVGGTRLLLWTGYGACIGDYSYTQTGKGRWRDHHSTITPTHWMPLPKPPVQP
jgi:hypothetical protein